MIGNENRNRNDNRDPQDVPVFQERRKRVDWVTRMATILSITSWTVAFFVWVVIDMAQPEKPNMFTTMFRIQVRDYWDTSLLPTAFLLLLASLGICILAFIFNKLRKRRKTDQYKISIFVVGAITILGIVLFLNRFGLSVIF